MSNSENKSGAVVVAQIGFGERAGLPGLEELKTLGWSGDTPVWSYTESLSRCRIVRTTYGEIKLPEDAIEGRVFDKRGELRWVCGLDTNGNRRVASWITVERPAGSAALPGETRSWKAVPQETKYYLIGTWGVGFDGRQAAWREARYGNREMEYPLTGVKENDRPWIGIHEYRPVKPETWPRSDGEVTKALNQPRVLAHRFAEVGVGQEEN